MAALGAGARQPHAQSRRSLVVDRRPPARSARRRPGGRPTAARRRRRRDCRPDDAIECRSVRRCSASSADPGATQALVSALRAADGPALTCIVRGLELLGTRSALRGAAAVLGERDTPACKAALCRLKAFLRVAPGAELAAAFESGDSDAQGRRRPRGPASAAAFGRGMDRARPVEHRPRRPLRRGRNGHEPRRPCGVARRDRARCRTRRALRSVPASAGAVRQRRRARSRAMRRFASPALRPQAVWALGHIGTVRAAEACIAGMKHDALARACGEAYCWITGADLARDGLARTEDCAGRRPRSKTTTSTRTWCRRRRRCGRCPTPTPSDEHWLTRRPAMDPTARHVRGAAASRSTRARRRGNGPHAAPARSGARTAGQDEGASTTSRRARSRRASAR